MVDYCQHPWIRVALNGKVTLWQAQETPMARIRLPATSFALLVFIGFAMLALIGLVIGLGRTEAGFTWAIVLLLGIAVMALVVGAVRRTGGRLAKEP
jgi:peptidoglycan/LPS O-acetylase OafA/YrhL